MVTMYAMGEETHPAAPLVEVRGKCIQGVDVGNAAGVVDVLAWHHPRLHCGQHTHKQLSEAHFRPIVKGQFGFFAKKLTVGTRETPLV